MTHHTMLFVAAAIVLGGVDVAAAWQGGEFCVQATPPKAPSPPPPDNCPPAIVVRYGDATCASPAMPSFTCLLQTKLLPVETFYFHAEPGGGCVPGEGSALGKKAAVVDKQMQIVFVCVPGSSGPDGKPVEPPQPIVIPFGG